jgi:hypothetical protein
MPPMQLCTVAVIGVAQPPTLIADAGSPMNSPSDSTSITTPTNRQNPLPGRSCPPRRIPQQVPVGEGGRTMPERSFNAHTP